MAFVKLYLAALVAFFALDLTWLGLVARSFYREQMGHLMRADVQWAPALLFYVIYIAAVVVLCVQPAIEKQSATHAVTRGALLGLAAYAAFDLTSLALLKDYPMPVAVVDLLWGTVLTGSVSGAAFLFARATA